MGLASMIIKTYCASLNSLVSWVDCEESTPLISRVSVKCFAVCLT